MITIIKHMKYIDLLVNNLEVKKELELKLNLVKHQEIHLLVSFKKIYLINHQNLD